MLIRKWGDFMNERIKQLRRDQALTQREFGEKLGMKQNTIATWEMGRGRPSSRAVRTMCRQFHVREAWLRDGEGEMYLTRSGEEQLAELFERARTQPESFCYRALVSLSRLSDAEWAALEKIFAFSDQKQ